MNTVRMRANQHPTPVKKSTPLQPTPLSEFTPAELSALRIDGHVYPLGFGVILAGPVEPWWARLESCIGQVPRRAVVDELTAAWVWGALDDRPEEITCSIDRRFRSTQPLSGTHHFRYRRYAPGESIRGEDISVTSPERTRQDLIRANLNTEANAGVLARLEQLGVVVLPSGFERD